VNVALQAHAEGTILPVRARAGARRNAIGGIQGGALHVFVTQAPEKGKANKAIVAVLADALGVRKHQLELLAGESSPQKRILVRGIGPSELAARVERLVQNL
jgi:uncharacterized protein (TIGR00251 family)